MVVFVDHDDLNCVRHYVASNAASWKSLIRRFARIKHTRFDKLWKQHQSFKMDRHEGCPERCARSTTQNIWPTHHGLIFFHCVCPCSRFSCAKVTCLIPVQCRTKSCFLSWRGFIKPSGLDSSMCCRRISQSGFTVTSMRWKSLVSSGRTNFSTTTTSKAHAQFTYADC